MFSHKRFRIYDCSNFVGLLFVSWLHKGLNTIHRPPWQNLIDVADLSRNVTKRDSSQQNMAGREETYNQLWQTVVRRRASVTDTSTDREETYRDLTELEWLKTHGEQRFTVAAGNIV